MYLSDVSRRFILAGERASRRVRQTRRRREPRGGKFDRQRPGKRAGECVCKREATDRQQKAARTPGTPGGMSVRYIRREIYRCEIGEPWMPVFDDVTCLRRGINHCCAEADLITCKIS